MQSDLFLSNLPGASFRAELNQVIEALATNNGGTIDPVPAFPSMWFADWTANMLRRRRKDNTAWIDVSPIDEALLKATSAEVIAGTEATKAITPATLRSAASRCAHDCRFDYVNGTTCRLSRYGGDKITIDAQLRTIPVGGVDLAHNAAFATGGLLYVYVYLNAGVMTLFAAVGAAPIEDARDGNLVHPTDASFTWVGGFFGDASGFVKTASRLGVLSAWNRRNRVISSSGAGVATGSTTPVPLTQVDFLSFGLDGIIAVCAGYVVNSYSGIAVCSTDLRLDGNSLGALSVSHTTFAGHAVPATASYGYEPVAGWHSTMPYGNVSGGVGTWANLAQSVMVRG